MVEPDMRAVHVVVTCAGGTESPTFMVGPLGHDLSIISPNAPKGTMVLRRGQRALDCPLRRRLSPSKGAMFVRRDDTSMDCSLRRGLLPSHPVFNRPTPALSARRQSGGGRYREDTPVVDVLMTCAATPLRRVTADALTKGSTERIGCPGRRGRGGTLSSRPAGQMASSAPSHASRRVR